MRTRTIGAIIDAVNLSQVQQFPIPTAAAERFRGGWPLGRNSAEAEFSELGQFASPAVASSYAARQQQQRRWPARGR